MHAPRQAMLLTVGHGTLAAEDFTALLRSAGVRALVDIRRFPGSRRHPHVHTDQMRVWLPEAGVAYRWEERLGGRRSRVPGSPNTGLRNASFAGYADWMATPVFWQALDQVLAEAAERSTAVMCSESLWWRCHRRMVADAALLARGVEVRHLLHDGRLAPHVVTDVARRDGELVVYDGGQPALPPLGEGPAPDR